MAKSPRKRPPRSSSAGKRHSKPRKKASLFSKIQFAVGRKLLWGAIFLWIVSAAFLGLLLLKHKPRPRHLSAKHKTRLPYERPEPLGIENKIQNIDFIIYHSLLDSGMYSENIKYRVEQKNNKRGVSWEYCEMQIPSKKNVRKFYTLLTKRLKKKLPGISISFEKSSSKRETITIRLQKLVTHRLVFTERKIRPAERIRGPRPRIAIVIDDFGAVYRQAKEFSKIKVPITFSVLPFRRHSKEIARMAHEKGFEVMLHLPMEPYGYPSINPGEGALLLAMSGRQIREMTDRCLDDLDSYVSGVNNHMGSAFTENAEKMKVALMEIKRRNLFFLDSLTSPRSVAYKIALSLNLSTCRRDIFLDVKQTREFVNGQLRKLVSIAKKRGKAIAIGHPYTVTLKVLKEKLPYINRTEAKIVPVSELIK